MHKRDACSQVRLGASNILLQNYYRGGGLGLRFCCDFAIGGCTSDAHSGSYAVELQSKKVGANIVYSSDKRVKAGKFKKY